MMIIVLFLVGCVFVGCGYLLTEKNARSLLAGYNTLSEEEKSRFDLKSFLKFFRQFHLVLGISFFFLGSLVYFFIGGPFMKIFLVVLPTVFYIQFFIRIRSGQFRKESE